MKSSDGLIKLIGELINEIDAIKDGHKKILSAVEVIKKGHNEDPVVSDLVGWLDHIIENDGILFSDLETMLKNLNEVITSYEYTWKSLETKLEERNIK